MGKGGHGGHGGWGGGHGGFHHHRGFGGHGGHGFYGPPRRPIGLGIGIGVGMALRAERRAVRRAYRYNRRGYGYGYGGYSDYGYGHPVTVVQAPPPPPHAISDTTITHFRNSGNVVLYHVVVRSVTGLQWEVAARYSAFHTLYERLGHMGLSRPFPPKKPLRSMFGVALGDGAKEERRLLLQDWLAEAVQLAANDQFVGLRRPLNDFLRTPPELCVGVPVDSATVTATPVTGGGGAAPAAMANTVQVQMPSGVRPGESLAIEHHGLQYSIPAPADVAPGAVFTVTLPDDDAVASTSTTMATTAIPPPPQQQQQQQQQYSSAVSASPAGGTLVAESVQTAVPVGYGGGGSGGVFGGAAAPAVATASASANVKGGSANPF